MARTTSLALPSQVSITETSLRADENLSFRDWQRIGKQLGMIGRNYHWWLGDWLNFAEAKWGEKYKKAAEVTGLGIQHLTNVAWTARHVAPERRRARLSYTHHNYIAALPEEDQEYWLNRAEELDLDTVEFRTAVRAGRPIAGSEPIRAAQSVGIGTATPSSSNDSSSPQRGAYEPTGDDMDEVDGEVVVQCPHCGEEFSL